jgi:hypothetical protein
MRIEYKLQTTREPAVRRIKTTEIPGYAGYARTRQRGSTAARQLITSASDQQVPQSYHCLLTGALNFHLLPPLLVLVVTTTHAERRMLNGVW